MVSSNCGQECRGDIAHQLKRRPEMRKVYERAFGATIEGMRERSVINWVDELSKNTPLLILQGADDKRTNPESVKRFINKLASTDVDYRFELFEGASHALKDVEDKAFVVVKEWFNKYVTAFN